MNRPRIMKDRVCPKCGRTYSMYPALSRDDNKTEICPDCGTQEALKAMINRLAKGGDRK